MEITSTAFAEGEAIPVKHTCDGNDLSPQLAWTGTPGGTVSFALICDDPDAPRGTWVHWVLFNLPPSITGLSEGAPSTGTLPIGGVQGTNDFGSIGYGGPCPPPGGAHRYFFRICALDGMLDLEAGASRAEVDSAMRGHILAEGELMGTYQRR